MSVMAMFRQLLFVKSGDFDYSAPVGHHGNTCSTSTSDL